MEELKQLPFVKETNKEQERKGKEGKGKGRKGNERKQGVDIVPERERVTHAGALVLIAIFSSCVVLLLLLR